MVHRPAIAIGGHSEQNRLNGTTRFHELLHPLGRGDRPHPSDARAALRRDARPPARRARHHQGALLPRRPGRRRRALRGLRQPADQGARRRLRPQPAARDRADLLLERMRLAEPTVWEPGRAWSKAAPPRMSREPDSAGRLWCSEVIGDGWWHGFDVAVFGPGGRRGLFKINAPLEQPLEPPLHGRSAGMSCRTSTSPSATSSCRPRRGPAASGRREALAGVAVGRKADAVADDLGITGRGVEERLARARKRLGCPTTQGSRQGDHPRPDRLGARTVVGKFGIAHRGGGSPRIVRNFPSCRNNHRWIPLPLRLQGSVPPHHDRRRSCDPPPCWIRPAAPGQSYASGRPLGPCIESMASKIRCWRSAGRRRKSP